MSVRRSSSGSRRWISRAAAFRSLVRNFDPERVLRVGIDVAKASWFKLGSTLGGDIVLDGVKLTADARGLAELQRLIACAREECRAQLVLVGIEAAGHYHQTLAAHLNERQNVTLAGRAERARLARAFVEGVLGPISTESRVIRPGEPSWTAQ